MVWSDRFRLDGVLYDAIISTTDPTAVGWGSTVNFQIISENKSDNKTVIGMRPTLYKDNGDGSGISYTCDEIAKATLSGGDARGSFEFKPKNGASGRDAFVSFYMAGYNIPQIEFYISGKPAAGLAAVNIAIVPVEPMIVADGFEMLDGHYAKYNAFVDGVSRIRFAPPVVDTRDGLVNNVQTTLRVGETVSTVDADGAVTVLTFMEDAETAAFDWVYTVQSQFETIVRRGRFNVTAILDAEIMNVDMKRYTEIYQEETGQTKYVVDENGEKVWLGFFAGAPLLNRRNGLTLLVHWMDGSLQHEGEVLFDLENLKQEVDLHYEVEIDGNTETGRGILGLNTFDPAMDWTFRITIIDDLTRQTREVQVAQSGAIFNIEPNGVAVGMRSKGTEEKPLFEVNYKTVLYEDVVRYVGGEEVPLGGINYSMGREEQTADVWIDGRHIYRRVLPLQPHTSGTQTQTVADISGFGENMIVVSLRGMLYSGANYTGNVYPLPYAHYTAAQEVAVYVENNVIKTYAYGSTRTWASGWVLIEYVRDAGANKTKYPPSPLTGKSYRVVASSINSNSYPEWHAFDGDIKTSWASHGFSKTGEWIQYEMPKALTDIDVYVYGRSSNYLGYPSAGTIELSRDGETWITGGTFSGWTQTSAGGLLGVVQCENESLYTFVRLNITTKGGNQDYVAIGFIEIRGFEASQSDEV